VPVIAVSGFAAAHVPALAEAPFYRILLKPLDIAVLVDEILTAIAMRRTIN